MEPEELCVCGGGASYTVIVRIINAIRLAFTGYKMLLFIYGERPKKVYCKKKKKVGLEGNYYGLIKSIYKKNYS